MNMETMTAFLGWCALINIGLLLYMAPDFLFRVQSRLVPLERDRFNAIYYGFIGGYKILVLVFNIVPYIALRIIA